MISARKKKLLIGIYFYVKNSQLAYNYIMPIWLKFSWFWWNHFSEFLRNYLRFPHFSIFWKILGNFSDFFRKFSIVSENYTIRNEYLKRQFRFLKNSKKSLTFFLDISYFLRTRWDWETKNSRKIAETLDLKNSVKNHIFSVKNFYFIRIQQNWEHDNFEKIWETSHLENFEKNLIFPK